MNFDPDDDRLYTEHLDELSDEALDALYCTLQNDDSQSQSGFSLGSYLALDLYKTSHLLHMDSNMGNSAFNKFPSDLSMGSFGSQPLTFDQNDKGGSVLERQPTLDLRSYQCNDDELHVSIKDIYCVSKNMDPETVKKCSEINDLKSSFFDKIEKLKEKQLDILTNNSLGKGKEHERELIRFEETIQNELQSLHDIIRYYTLDYETLISIKEFVSFIQLLLQRTGLYRKELLNHFNDDSNPIFNLLISSQPFPLVIFKEKPIEESYVVSLLTGTTDNIDNIADIKASLVTGDFVYKSKKEPLKNYVSKFDPNDLKALFSDLTINLSTRMNTISLQFTTIINSNSNDYLIRSQPSYPFIIITNESQWCEAAGKLLITDAFAGMTTIQWSQFSNTFHSHYLKSTKAKNIDIDRPLYLYEINYFHVRFFKSKNTINEEDANNFWKWFGPCLHAIRFKRHILSLWTQGCIFGFIIKEESVRLLSTQPEGTFIIRFSESNPGVFGIACSTGVNEPVEHFLVRGEDIGSNKSLAEFLRDKNQFKYILQFYPDTLKAKRVPKDEALGAFYSKKKNTMSDTHGYLIL